MNAEIIAVGTELLLGEILNTNAQFLSQNLSNLGIDVYFQTVVGDNPKRLKETFETALTRADIIILTGGLGPTKDDLTKETVAQTMGLTLELHTESLQKIKVFFSSIHREMTINNEKQAYLPKGCMALENHHGTAPGCLIEHQQKVVVMLPGPPQEMKPMFTKYVYPYLRSKGTNIIYSRVLRIFGVGESALEEMLSDIMENQHNPTIAPYAKQGEVALRITAKCESEETAKKMIAPLEKTIRQRLGFNVYGEGNTPLAEVVGSLLKEKGKTVAVAESCTGGLLSEQITRSPGISKCFITGAITYSNESKIKLLNVSPQTLDKYGAVSEQTALEMAEGVKRLGGTDIGISITGIAGPDGGTQEKPVGCIYIGVVTNDKSTCKKINLVGDRLKIRNMTAMHALDMIRHLIVEHVSEKK